jgi:hypothetical protein
MNLTLKTIVFSLLMAASVSMNAQNPVAYMDKISAEFKKISEETWDYTRAVAHNKKARQIEGQRKQMLNANRSGLNRVKNMQGFNGSTAYRDSTVRYLELSYAILNNDYSKIVDMEEISEQSYDAMEAYMMAQQVANDKLEAAFDIAVAANEKFAADNNIRLIDDKSKTGDKLEKASEVFKFYNQIYLVFFKPYKQEIYLLDAQTKSDINAMKQNQESLSKLSKDAKEKLKTITPYKNNTTLKAACNQVLDFYIMEADTKVSSLIDFYLKKEKFDKLKTAMDKKGKNVTQAEANEYNAAVNDYNKASGDYNKINTELNNKRAAALDNWNNAVSRYLDKNVSKQK